jgi:hypothetical protein
MAAEAAGLDDLLQIWRGLASGDRKAIMRRLPPDRRRQFQRLVAASTAGSEEAEQALRYRMYSPWLGRLLEACEGDSGGVPLPKPHVMDALMRAHLKAEETVKGRDGRISLFDILRSTVLEWGKRL